MLLELKILLLEVNFFFALGLILAFGPALDPEGIYFPFGLREDIFLRL
jgi:hypothetical protein